MENTKKNTNPIKFFVALRGERKPSEYIRLAKFIEDLGYDRIYVYDDLMFYSSTQILTLIAEHTKKIEVGPCLVNGYYRHPAIIAQEAAFLEEMAPGRSVLGIGRGAFFDFYNMENSEEHTRTGILETTQQVNRLLLGNTDELYGTKFQATGKAFLRVPKPARKVPVVIGSWNSKIAAIAGEHAEELQVAEVWNAPYLSELKNNFTGNIRTNGKKMFNIGGMSCISDDIQKACHIAKDTAAIYIPYLNMLIQKYGYDPNSDYFQEIFDYSRKGDYKKSASLISDEIIQKVALVGTPEDIVERIRTLHDSIGIDGIMMSPPYGAGTLEDDLELIMNKVVKVINS
jgi:alkanesulfonate monooxygenase SsuD/methylene tetrahydromethanopterin reductase-like flavin-dependent oxidoreductase (luciferase family)